MAERVTIKELVVELLFEGEESGITKFNSALQTFRVLAGAAEAGIRALSDAVIGSTLQLADQADALGESAAQVGVSAIAYDALSAAIQKNGGEVADLDGALRTLSGNLADFRKTGEGAGKDAFEAVLGPNARTRLAEVSSVDEALSLLADGLAAIKDPTEQVALANDLLGRSGNKLLPTLQGGAAGLREAMRAMEEAGTFSAELLQASSDLGDGVADLGLRWRGLKILVGEETVPALGELVDELGKSLEAARKAFGPEIRAGARLVADLFRFLRDVARSWREEMDHATAATAAFKTALIFLASLGLAAVLAGLVALGPWLPFLAGWFVRTGLVAVVAGAKAAAAWVLAALPVVVLAALLTGIVLILEDLITYVQGGESAFGALLDKMREGGPVLESLADWLEYIFGGGIGNDLFDGFERLKVIVGEVVDGILAIPGAIAAAFSAGAGDLPRLLAKGGADLARIPQMFVGAGEAAAAGGGGQTNNVQVGGSSVSVQVNGAADPRATGAEVARQTDDALSRQAARVGRDLAPVMRY